MNATRFQQGTFCWADLSTTDYKAAQDFYGKLMGWSAQPVPMPDNGVYVMMQKDGKTAGAITRLGEDKKGVPPHWMLYIAVDDANAMAEKIKGAGGMVHAGPFDAMEAGRMAICADPTGAPFAIWEGRETPGVGIQKAIGGMCWHELLTSDTAKVGAFYGAVFGWTPKANDMGGMVYTVFHLGEAQVGGMMTKPPQMKMPDCWQVYFQVPDCDAAVQTTRAMGGNACMEPMEVPGVGRFCTLTDPQGAAFAVLSS